MATQTSLNIRQRDAYERIAKAVSKLARGTGAKPTDVLALRHRDPNIEATQRIEAIADDVEALVKVQAKASKADTLQAVEAQLEAETGSDVVQTGSEPPTFVETDKPAVPRRSNRK